MVSCAGCPFIDIQSRAEGCEGCLCWGDRFRGTVDLSVGGTHSWDLKTGQTGRGLWIFELQARLISWANTVWQKSQEYTQVFLESFVCLALKECTWQPAGLLPQANTPLLSRDCLLLAQRSQSFCVLTFFYRVLAAPGKWESCVVAAEFVVVLQVGLRSMRCFSAGKTCKPAHH